MGKKFEPNEPLTRGCEVKVLNAVQSQISETWKEAQNYDHFINHMAKAVNTPTKIKRKTSKVNATDRKRAAKQMQLVNKKQIKDYGKRYEISLNLNEKFDNTSHQATISLWDFGAQEVFYSLHHLFLTEQSCFLLVFNASEILTNFEGSRSRQVEFLNFWLNSKKLHAEGAPLVIVGTHCSDFVLDSCLSVNKIIEERALKQFSFNEVRFKDVEGNGFENLGLSFYPVDSKTGLGIRKLRKGVETIFRNQEFMKAKVRLSFMHAYDDIKNLGKDFVHLSMAHKILEKYQFTMNEVNELLNFLAQRGLITFVPMVPDEYNCVILNPQWLIDGISQIIYDINYHKEPDFDGEFNKDFRRYLQTGVLTSGLMENIWSKAYTAEIQNFFKSVMTFTLLQCEYKFRNEEAYIIPTFPNIGNSVQLPEALQYSGPYFILDFFGHYESTDQFVRYLPFGIFERLLCLMVSHSAKFDDFVEPQIMGQLAHLCFGTRLRFRLEVTENISGEKLWIKFRTYEGTSYADARDLIRITYSMMSSVREDFFTQGIKKDSLLSLKLLLPSSAETGSLLTSYELLLARQSTPAEATFFVRLGAFVTADFKYYSHWFESPGTKLGRRIENNLLTPTISEASPRVRLIRYRKLPSKLKYHCFLSYIQKDTKFIVGQTFVQLCNLGYKCWYDQQYRGSDGLTSEAMKQGVQDSMVYVLFLSKNIFYSNAVKMELSTAVSTKKKIMFLHHPDTEKIGYVGFNHYIDTAPKQFKKLFYSVDSIQLRTRFYEEEGVLQEIRKRLEAIRLNILGRQKKIKYLNNPNKKKN
eukprot:snap_masked-scaffold_12-processed-gene-6.17-mRNA-1 protein AED:0.43 eAED:0.46 QI:0/-1/0/1/-1/1/1/0/807